MTDLKLTGLELREAVAMEVMGFKKPRPIFTDDDGAVHVGYPPYETSLQAAWKVVEAMRAKGWYMLIAQQPGEWRAAIKHEDSGTGDNLRVFAPTAPEAIALAALTAIRSIQ